MHNDDQLKQITYELADVNFYREPERFTELFNRFISLSSESGLESWKNKITCALPFMGFLEEIPFLVML